MLKFIKIAIPIPTTEHSKYSLCASVSAREVNFYISGVYILRFAVSAHTSYRTVDAPSLKQHTVIQTLSAAAIKQKRVICCINSSPATRVSRRSHKLTQRGVINNTCECVLCVRLLAPCLSGWYLREASAPQQPRAAQRNKPKM